MSFKMKRLPFFVPTFDGVLAVAVTGQCMRTYHYRAGRVRGQHMALDGQVVLEYGQFDGYILRLIYTNTDVYPDTH